MPPEPNIYELNANLKNLTDKVDQLYAAEEKYASIQIEILTKIAEQKQVSDYVFFRLSALEESNKKTSAFFFKCTGGLAVIAPFAGWLLTKIF